MSVQDDERRRRRRSGGCGGGRDGKEKVVVLFGRAKGEGASAKGARGGRGQREGETELGRIHGLAGAGIRFGRVAGGVVTEKIPVP